MNCFINLVDMPNHEIHFLRTPYGNPTEILRKCSLLQCVLNVTAKS